MQSSESSTQAKMKNVLLATDFSPSSQTALLYSLGIAKRNHARVFITHVINTQRLLGQDSVQRAVNDAWREAHQEMTNQLIAGRLEGVENKILIEQGEVWEELSKVIKKHKIDLLVTGTRGRTGVWKILLGSTAEKIFRNSSIPVLTVGPRVSTGVPPAEGPRRILYAIGFSAQSLYASKYAFAIARHQQANLALLHVDKESDENSQWMRAQQERDSRKRLEELIPPDLDLGQKPDIFVAFGTPAEAILNTAAEWRPDLIVMGLRRMDERSAKKATWATAYNVVSNAPCPVLTVRAPEDIA